MIPVYMYTVDVTTCTMYFPEASPDKANMYLYHTIFFHVAGQLFTVKC